MKQEVKTGTGLAPVPVAMVSCGDMEESNIITVAWTGVINSEPPLVYVSIRPTRKSYEMIKKRKEFVINLPDQSLVWEADFCGTKSGKEVNKFEQCKLTRGNSSKVGVPIIEECPINIECTVKEIQDLGSHHMFISEVVAIHCNEEYIDNNGVICYGNASLLTYAGNQYLAQNREVAKRGICLK